MSEESEKKRVVAARGAGSATSRKVLKVMSVFTGVEALGILCTIIRSKLIAIWLNAACFGLFGIFNNTIETLTYLTGLGLRQSAVRDISLANSEGESKLRSIIRRVRSWSVVAGLLGAAAISAAAWPMAVIVLGDGRLWWNFIILAAAMLMNALYAGECAVFQGTESFSRMARTSLQMSIVGLLISIPMFRYMGSLSVPWSIVAYSASGVFFAFINRDKRLSRERPSRAELKGENDFVKFGAWLSVTAFINSVCQLVFYSWLNSYASMSEVGYYAAGMTIAVRYTSLVFNSVGLEFYPRISANLRHPERLEIFTNHEVSLLVLLFTPIVLLFIAFRQLAVLLLYDADYMVILPFVTWGILVVLLRAVSNTMAYTIMARGEGKIYLITDSLDALLGLGLSIWFYMEAGLAGAGMALVVWHLTYLIVVEEICRRRYGLRLRGATLRVVIASYLTCGIALIAVEFLPTYAVGGLLTAAALVWLMLFWRFFRHRRRR